ERGDFAGGSWLSATTHGGTRIYRLPGRGELRSAVRLFTGMFDRRNGSEAAPAVSLYQQLLEKPLAEFLAGGARRPPPPRAAPPAPRRGGPGARGTPPPLGVRSELTEIPSATLWLGWKGERPPAAAIPALALADPPLPGGAAGSGPPKVTAAKERAAIFA